MIDFGPFQFGCQRFCGTLYVADMMTSIGFSPPSLVGIRSPIIKDDGKLSISLVRNPKSWLADCYDAINKGLVDDLHPFTELPTHSFQGFISTYIQEFPGSLSESFGRYKADSIMRVEDMPWALLELLIDLRVDRDRAHAIKKITKPPMHDTYKIDFRLLNMLRSAERVFCDSYDY